MYFLLIPFLPCFLMHYVFDLIFYFKYTAIFSIHSMQHGETLVDEQGNVIQTVDAIKPPKGWNWSTKDGWKVDLNRAVDHDGKDKKIYCTTVDTKNNRS